MTKKVILKDKNNEELIPYTSLATGAEAGRVRPDGTTLGVDSDGVLSVDQGLIDSQNGTISNCILDIPQNIKLTLENNVLTLKAGSTVVNGQAVYTTVTTTEDKNYTISSGLSGRYLVFVRVSDFAFNMVRNDKCVSGATDSLAELAENHIWLDTTAKEINIVFSTSGKAIRSYPLCIVDVVDGVASFAKDSNGNDMIFNGMGFVGHHIFIYPNINAYMPAELNPDGSLASTKVNTNALRIIEALSGYGVDSLKRWISLQSNRTVSNWSAYKEVNHDSEADYSIANIRYYARDINLIKMYRSGSVSAVDGVPLVEYYYDGSTITSFTPRQPVRTATVEMLDKVQAKVDTNTTAIAGKQDVLVSGTNIKTINSTTVLGSGNFTLADQSLSNLDSNGQMIVESQNGTISNCILNIPQNIKLTLENNVLTLKAGSILTRTGDTYTTITTATDKTYTVSSNQGTGKYVVLCQQGSGTIDSIVKVNEIYSGTTAQRPENVSIGYKYFNVDTKRWNLKGSSAWNENWAICYPICVIDVDSNHIASFAKDSNGNDMIFNGAGFIGHHAFVYPNVKALIPDGLNADGSLKSVNKSINALRILELQQIYHKIFITNFSSEVQAQNLGGSVATKEDLPLNFIFYYITAENIIGRKKASGTYMETSICSLVDYSYDGTTVTDFTIRQPVRTATVEMLKDKQDVLTFDSTPIASSTNPVTSGGVYTALGAKQSTLTFDTTPTVNSTNPVTSGGIYNAINGAKTYKGTHDLTVQYREGDIVKSGTKFFEALQDNINISTANTANWSKLSNDALVINYEKSDNTEYPIGLADANASGSAYIGPLLFTTQNKPTINASTGVITATGGVVGKTETAGDNSTKYASTAFVQTELANKFQVVTALPANPDANTFYFIVEE